MLNFLRKLFKKDKKSHPNKTVHQLDELSLPIPAQVNVLPKEQSSGKISQVTFIAPVQPEPALSLPKEKAPAIYGTRTKASAVKIRKRHKEALEDKAREVTAQLAQPKPCLSMKEEIELKAKEIQFRTGNQNQYYRSQGVDSLNLNGRLLKSAFENEQGEKLSADKRQEIMRDLQTGKRKRAWQ